MDVDLTDLVTESAAKGLEARYIIFGLPGDSLALHFELESTLITDEELQQAKAHLDAAVVLRAEMAALAEQQAALAAQQEAEFGNIVVTPPPPETPP